MGLRPAEKLHRREDAAQQPIVSRSGAGRVRADMAAGGCLRAVHERGAEEARHLQREGAEAAAVPPKVQAAQGGGGCHPMHRRRQLG